MRLLRSIAERFALPGSAARDAVFLAVEKAVNVAVSFFVSIMVVHYLGPEQYGIFSYVTIWVSVLAPLAMLGLPGPLMKSLVQQPRNTDQTIATALVIRTVAAAVVSCVAIGVFASGLLLGSVEHSGHVASVVAILAMQYFAQALDVFETYNQANGRITQTTRARLIALLAVSALRVAAVKLEAPLATFAWLVVLQLLMGFWLTYAGIKPPVPARWTFDSAEARRMSSMGSFVVLAGVLNMVQARCEVFILERFAGLEAVGLYAASLRFVELFDTLGTIAVTVYLPHLLASSDRKIAGDDALVWTYRISLLFFLCVIPVIAAMAVAAHWLLGDKFIGIHWVILAMAYRPLFAFLGLTRSMYMLTENRLRYGALCSLVGLLVSVVSALILIPQIGIYGAAGSAFLGFLCSNLAIDAVLNRRYFRAFLRALTFR